MGRCFAIRHPGQVPLSGMRAGIQIHLIFRDRPGFRVSLNIVGLARNDSFVELRHSLSKEGIDRSLTSLC
jgi:hypothetical protein